MSLVLRDYQEHGIAEIRSAFASGYEAPLLQFPTGSGKTVCFGFITKSAAANGHRVLILAHRDTLIKQASAKLREYNVPHGIIMADYTAEPNKRVQLASVQTMVQRIRKYRYEFELIIIDECHRSAANSYKNIIAAIPDARVLGVTATPGRLDGRGLGKHAGCFYDILIPGPSIGDLTNRRYLARPRHYVSRDQLDLSGVKQRGGDYEEKSLAAAVDKPVITGSAVEHHKEIELTEGQRPALAWCINIKHAEHVTNQFNDNGIPFAILSGKNKGDERDRALQALAARKLAGIAFCQLLIEGIDVPAISELIMLRPTQSLTAYLQVCGRGGRMDPTDPGKVDYIILDHAGLTFMHGLADSDREWSLDGRPKKSKVSGIPLMQCPRCYLVFKPAPLCPGCGHVMTTERKPDLEYVDGKLEEIPAEVAERLRKNRQQDRRRRMAMAKTIEDFEQIGREYNYHSGWARIQWGLREAARQKRDEEFDAMMSGDLWQSYTNR